MSVSSVGSSNFLQWPFQADSAGGSSDTSPTDALQSLYQALTGGGNSSDPLIAALGQDSGSGDSSTSNSSSSSCGMPQISADTMSALLSMQSGQGSPAGDIAKDVIAKFDTNGDGQISQSEFENAVGSGADKSAVDALFNKLDSNGDGSVSQSELQSAMQQAHGGGHHHHHAEASSDSNQQQGGTDPLQALLSGASSDGTSSQSSTNADGSTTTTITYSDGTKLEMTTPAASSDSSNSNGSNSGSGNPNAFNLGNLLKMIVNLQAQYASPTTNVSV